MDTARYRPGEMVRVMDPGSPHFGKRGLVEEARATPRGTLYRILLTEPVNVYVECEESKLTLGTY